MSEGEVEIALVRPVLGDVLEARLGEDKLENVLVTRLEDAIESPVLGGVVTELEVKNVGVFENTVALEEVPGEDPGAVLEEGMVEEPVLEGVLVARLTVEDVLDNVMLEDVPTAELTVEDAVDVPVLNKVVEVGLDVQDSLEMLLLEDRLERAVLEKALGAELEIAFDDPVLEAAVDAELEVELETEPEATLESGVLEGKANDTVEEAWLEGEVATVLEGEKDRDVKIAVLEDIEGIADDCVELPIADVLEVKNVSEDELEDDDVPAGDVAC